MNADTFWLKIQVYEDPDGGCPMVMREEVAAALAVERASHAAALQAKDEELKQALSVVQGLLLFVTDGSADAVDVTDAVVWLEEQGARPVDAQLAAKGDEIARLKAELEQSREALARRIIQGQQALDARLEAAHATGKAEGLREGFMAGRAAFWEPTGWLFERLNNLSERTDSDALAAFIASRTPTQGQEEQ